MRRFLAGLGFAMGLAWLFGRRKRARPAPAADPAEELKRKLEESRGAEPAPAEPPTGSSLEERRRVVHDKARAAIEAMQGDELLGDDEPSTS